MHVVTVLFQVHQEHLAAFRAEMLRNAEQSLALEPGCRQFDVCEDGEAAVFLYEVYDAPSAFEAHLAMPHFLAFNQRTQAWVRSKLVKTFTRLAPEVS